jgi:hypothetical protein
MTLELRYDKGWAMWQGEAPARSASCNGLAFSCRERAGRRLQKPTILRAKRSTAMPGWAPVDGQGPSHPYDKSQALLHYPALSAFLLTF